MFNKFNLIIRFNGVLTTCAYDTALLSVLILFLSQPANATFLKWSGNDCQDSVTVHSNSATMVQVDPNTIVRANFQPSFFGFNLEWIGFQHDYWDPTTRTVRPQVVGLMKPFAGAIYRYPGGTVANYMNWNYTVGPLNQRPTWKVVDWAAPFAADFGFDEYLNFMKQVGGIPWNVANLYGAYGQEKSSSVMASQNGDWAAYARNKAASSGVGIYRWELGNELDRDIYHWSPQKYASTANTNATAILAKDTSAKFVALLEDFDAYPGMTSTEYDHNVVQSLPSNINEFALHDYYDGPPGGPPIPNRLSQICLTSKVINDVRPNSAYKIWITENARWPTGKSTDTNWKSHWPETTNLEGALGVADFAIGLTQFPQVAGTMLHALGGALSPWPLIKKNAQNGALYPSAVYWAFRTLREGMLDTVLLTTNYSNNDSGYAGGYDVRAAVMTNRTKSHYSIWSINRANTGKDVKLLIPQLASRTMRIEHTYIGGMAKTSANTDSNMNLISQQKKYYALTFDKYGTAIITLPANSVSSISLSAY
jgi:alpha-L-arabinofuranosidase